MEKPHPNMTKNGKTSKKKYFDDLGIFEGGLAQKSKH